MFALVDCNNFYASCEKLFQPELRDKAVVVLSNNDGIIISRSPEAKALGLKMGEPWFKLDPELQKQIVKFSSNYTLYADMSARVMNNLARFSPQVEVYSIDECFVSLKGFKDLETYAKLIRETVIRNTGIPVSVGIAPSKTLAKMANKIAKKVTGVCVLDTNEKITEAVNTFPIDDLWGIGRQYCNKLLKQGISTAGGIREQPLEWIKENFTIQGVRMWYELHGRSCIPLTQIIERKKGICTSRGFGKLTGNYQELEEATANYAGRLAEKLRRDTSCASMLSVRLITNIHRQDLPQYFKGINMPLPHPTNNTADIVRQALIGLKKVYAKGYLFLKVEVMATGLIPEKEVQLNLFQNWDGPRQDKVSKLMDKLNQHYGRGTLRVAAEGFQKKWSMRREFLSPSFTTNWNDIVKVY